jgi:hypothetical protein
VLAVALATVVGARGGIAIGWAGMAVSMLLLVFSRLPRVRETADVAAVDQPRPLAESGLENRHLRQR